MDLNFKRIQEIIYCICQFTQHIMFGLQELEKFFQKLLPESASQDAMSQVVTAMLTAGKNAMSRQAELRSQAHR